MNSKKGQIGTGAILFMAITLIITVVIFGVLANFLRDSGLSTTSVSETLATTKNVSLELGFGNIINSTLTVYNETVTLGENNWTIDRSGLDNGIINVTCGKGPLHCINATTGVLTYNYSYTQSGFITSDITRTIVGLIPLMLGLLLVVFTVGFIAIKR